MKMTSDFHIHTELSICSGGPGQGGTLQGYLEAARREGITTLGFADHFWDEGVGFDSLYIDSLQAVGVPSYYKTQNVAHVWQLKREIDNTDTGDITVLFGVEGEYDPANHGIAITPATAEKLDFYSVAHSHTHMMMDKSWASDFIKHRDYMIQGFIDCVTCPVSDGLYSLVHPFEACASPQTDRYEIRSLISDDEYLRLFEMAAKKDIGIEVNISEMRANRMARETDFSEHERMFRLARRAGCQLVFGSDAHRCMRYDNLSADANEFIRLFDIKESDIKPAPKKK